MNERAGVARNFSFKAELPFATRMRRTWPQIDKAEPKIGRRRTDDGARTNRPFELSFLLVASNCLI